MTENRFHGESVVKNCIEYGTTYLGFYFIFQDDFSKWNRCVWGATIHGGYVLKIP